MKPLFLLLFCLFSITSSAQKNDSIYRKKIEIPRVTKAPKIDGILNDAAWEKAPSAENFIERTPKNGNPIPDSLQTTVKIVYGDLGIYFGAHMLDPNPSKIRRELTVRDQIGNDDFFFILLNGYNDRQQSMEFIITAAGVQFDAKMTRGMEDSSWNAIWYSAVDIHETGWNAEVFIPYSELRFPDKPVQEWGLQMEREFRRSASRYSWNHVDNTRGSFSLYDGEIHGIENVHTPVRLSVQPYVSTYVDNYDGQTEINFNGGMDLKYGINDAFTLDMILIPDFGQTKFDETVLNLSAFEMQYDEQRPFFTEGTELFTKGNLFYSRRVGGAPIGDVEIDEDEEELKMPASVDLINALKISGRTDKGLGIGFFNAITEKTWATVTQKESGESRRELVEPFTNYNILVLDQRFADNSSIAVVNTNTLREGDFRDANVTGLYLDHTNKKNTVNYALGSEGSWVNEESTKFGLHAYAEVAQISGRNRFQGGVRLKTLEYDINDLGYSGPTNFVMYSAGFHHRLLQPTSFLNNMYLNFFLSHKRRLEPDLFSTFVFNFNSSFKTKDFFGFGGGFETTPFGAQDIYEAREEGRFFKIPAYYDVWLWINTDFRKPLSLNVVADWYKFDEKGRGNFIVEFNPHFRASDKLNFELETEVNLSDKEEGFAEELDEEIRFGRRDRNTVVNSFGANYIFNNRMGLNLAVRHYYSEVFYSKFFSLLENGELANPRPATAEYDTTYNSWNLDLSFSWWFAPGSQLSLLYRNAAESDLEKAHLTLRNNIKQLFEEPQLNSFSLRLTYYLDYNRMKNWFSSSSSGNTQPSGHLSINENAYLSRKTRS